MRVADCEPGAEVQVDFGRLGMLTDAGDGRRRVVHGLIFTAVYSRHMFVWPTYRQTLADVIAGFEAAWAFFGGVFAVVIPDNMKAIVDQPPTPPSPGSTTPSASTPRRVGSRSTRRGSAARGISRGWSACVHMCGRISLPEKTSGISTTAGTRAEQWCAQIAGMRIHGTTRLRPAEVFAADELPTLKPVPEAVFDIPTWTHPKVAPDRHVQVAKALYSVPGELIGKRIDARADAHSVKLYWRGELIKVHPRVAPGRRHTDPADLPSEVSVYAMRDLTTLQRKAAAHGTHVGAYAAAVLEHPLPWTKMRQVYRLLGLVRRHGAERGRGRLPPRAGRRGHRRRAHRPDADPRRRGTTAADAEAARGRRPGSSVTGRFRRQEALMSPARPDAAPAVKPIEVSGELKALMRRLKLGQLLDTLPERLALARTNRLPHHDFLEMLFADEVTRRDRESAARRAKAAHLDPAMQLHAWDDSAAVSFDQQLWAELTSLRFLADAYNVLIMGPVGVGKTFLANALGHIAVRRGHSVHTERADKLFKRLRGARLDGTYEDEMRKLHRVELLIIDDLALHRLEATETTDFYELIVERHRNASTIITSNREPPEILTMMADPLLAQSAMDRLQSAAYELVIEGQSYRQRQKPKPAPATASD